MVCIEDLQAGNVSGSAAGTTEHRELNVPAKLGLNESIGAQGRAEFRS